MNHTPGPWYAGNAQGIADQPFSHIWSAGEQHPVALCSATPEMFSNARLIAAAPELLEACKAIDDWYDLIRQDYPEMLGPFKGARAAIAKVEGQ